MDNNPVDDGLEGMPLRATIVDGRLIVSIGIDTLAFAFNYGENNNPFDEDTNDFRQSFTVADLLVFAEDVCREMNNEGEDGSTQLTRFLDSMMEFAVEHGSLGIADPDEMRETCMDN